MYFSLISKVKWEFEYKMRSTQKRCLFKGMQTTDVIYISYSFCVSIEACDVINVIRNKSGINRDAKVNTSTKEVALMVMDTTTDLSP